MKLLFLYHLHHTFSLTHNTQHDTHSRIIRDTAMKLLATTTHTSICIKKTDIHDVILAKQVPIEHFDDQLLIYIWYIDHVRLFPAAIKKREGRKKASANEQEHIEANAKKEYRV